MNHHDNRSVESQLAEIKLLLRNQTEGCKELTDQLFLREAEKEEHRAIQDAAIEELGSQLRELSDTMVQHRSGRQLRVVFSKPSLTNTCRD